MRRFTLPISDVGRIILTRTPDVDDLRRRYAYVIRESYGDLVGRGRDLFCGQSPESADHPGAERMMGHLLVFLTDMPEDFPPRIAAWARTHHDDLTMAALDLEEGTLDDLREGWAP